MGGNGYDFHRWRRILTYELVQGEAVRQWMEAHTGGLFDARCAVSLGLTKDSEIIAGVLYEDWNHASITCHIAFKGRVTRDFLGAAFRYAFDLCGVNKIIAPVWADNLRMIALANNMGFIWEGTIRDAQPNGDILIFTMTRNQCRFLGNRYGKKR